MKGPRARAIRRPIIGLFAVSLGLLLASQIVMALYAWGLFERDMLPSLDRKATAVAISARAEILYALEIGIPYDDLVGMEDFFSQIREATQGLAFVALTSPAGELIHIHGADRQALGSMLSGVSEEALTRFSDGDNADPVTLIVRRDFEVVHRLDPTGLHRHRHRRGP